MIFDSNLSSLSAKPTRYILKLVCENIFLLEMFVCVFDKFCSLEHSYLGLCVFSVPVSLASERNHEVYNVN